MHYHFPVFHHYRLYDPADYNHLQVSSETKELFRHITRYTPQAIELETQLRPFIPEYIPAIGDIDAFLKVGYWDHTLQVCTCIYRALNEPLGSFICMIVYTVFFLSKVTRPDGKTETAGMLVVDEPRAKQSDPTVLDLQLRTLTKQTTVKPVVRNPCMNICIIYMCSTIPIYLLRDYFSVCTHRLFTVLKILTKMAKQWTTGLRVLGRSTARSHLPLYTTPSEAWVHLSLQ